MAGYPFDNWMVVTGNIATVWLSKEEQMREHDSEVRREVEVEAPPEEVWKAIATPEGRERWLGEPAREIHVERAEPYRRLAWWWASEDEPATRVEFHIVATPAGSRVVVVESAPRFPLAAMAAALTPVPA
jgi:uncharacterized protein YndB with AHSA1/START domain